MTRSWHERTPGLYRLAFQLADGQWWQAVVQANDYDEAQYVARAVCPEPGAPLLLNDRTDEAIDVRVVETSTARPRVYDQEVLWCDWNGRP